MTEPTQASALHQRLAALMARLPARRTAPGGAVHRYGTAFAMVCVALALREIIGPASLGLQFVTFFPAVALTAVYAGFGPGMLATALSVTLASFLYIAPYREFVFAFDRATLVSNLVFIIDELMVCGAIQAMHNHYGKLRLATERLAENRNLLHAIIEGTSDAIFLKDTAGRYEVSNSVHAHLSGRLPHEVVGQDSYAIYPPEQAQRLLANDALIMESGRVQTFDETLRFPDGKELHFLSTKGPIFDDAGRIRGIFGIARDVTERRRVEESLHAAKAEAERANNAKSRFLAAVSHDLRQPLSALSLYVGTLAGKLGHNDAALLANMKECVGSLNEMLSNLLDLSKLDAGVVTPRIADFSLDAAFTKIAAAQAPTAEAKGLALRFAYFGLFGYTDPLLFQRILGNLVSNAIRYTDRGGVLVGCRRRGGKNWVEVWDTGIGIPADKTSEIFEEFKQLGNAERNRAKGSGLGLTIVAKSAALLGLEIRVRSRPGKGSMFAIELPLGRRPAQPPAARRSYAHRPLAVALVEDNADVAKALAYALSALGHRVVAAASRAALMPLLGDLRPDLLISDYRLGGGETGIETITAIRAHFGAQLPAMIVTGDTDPNLIRTLAESGIYLQHKPVDIDHLQTAIAKLTVP